MYSLVAAKLAKIGFSKCTAFNTITTIKTPNAAMSVAEIKKFTLCVNGLVLIDSIISFSQSLYVRKVQYD